MPECSIVCDLPRFLEGGLPLERSNEIDNHLMRNPRCDECYAELERLTKAPDLNSNPNVLPIGSTLAGYRIVRYIGGGGMGEVYEVMESHGGWLDETGPYALKVIGRRVGPVDSPILAEAQIRFKREVKVTDRLSETYRIRGVVQVFAFGDDNGTYYYVTELLKGVSLREEISKHGPYAPRVAVSLILELTEIVAAVHRAGIIHRDLKPTNVMALDSGHLRVIDFGLAFDQNLDSNHTAILDRLTRRGQILGSEDYLAPEQKSGSAAPTPALDVYALGVMLLEIVTPDWTASRLRLAARQGKLDSAISQTGISNGLQKIIACAIAANPNQRYADAGQLASALKGYAKQCDADAEEAQNKQKKEIEIQQAFSDSRNRTHRHEQEMKCYAIGLAIVLTVTSGGAFLITGGIVLLLLLLIAVPIALIVCLVVGIAYLVKSLRREYSEFALAESSAWDQSAKIATKGRTALGLSFTRHLVRKHKDAIKNITLFAVGAVSSLAFLIGIGYAVYLGVQTWSLVAVTTITLGCGAILLGALLSWVALFGEYEYRLKSGVEFWSEVAKLGPMLFFGVGLLAAGGFTVAGFVAPIMVGWGVIVVAPLLFCCHCVIDGWRRAMDDGWLVYAGSIVAGTFLVCVENPAIARVVGL